MDSMAFAVGVLVLWIIFAACFYYMAIKKWLPKFDELPVEERIKLLETRRQRDLRSFNRGKRR
jgi:hypothetical protein